MRLFVYKTAKAPKSLAVFECEKVTKGKATVSEHVNIASVQPGMVCCPGEGRKVDRSTMYVVIDVERNNIVFDKEALTGIDTPPDEDAKP